MHGNEWSNREIIPTLWHAILRQAGKKRYLRCQESISSHIDAFSYFLRFPEKQIFQNCHDIKYIRISAFNSYPSRLRWLYLERQDDLKEELI